MVKSIRKNKGRKVFKCLERGDVRGPGLGRGLVSEGATGGWIGVASDQHDGYTRPCQLQLHSRYTFIIFLAEATLTRPFNCSNLTTHCLSVERDVMIGTRRHETLINPNLRQPTDRIQSLVRLTMGSNTGLLVYRPYLCPTVK